MSFVLFTVEKGKKTFNSKFHSDVVPFLVDLRGLQKIRPKGETEQCKWSKVLCPRMVYRQHVTFSVHIDCLVQHSVSGSFCSHVKVPSYDPYLTFMDRAWLKSFLHSIFHAKDLGQSKYFLEIEVSRSKKGTFLSQRKYILDLHEETGKSIVKPCTTPMAPNMQLTKDDGDPFNDPERYRKLVGKLNYNSFGYCFCSQCCQSVHDHAYSKTLCSFGANSVLLERRPQTWHSIQQQWTYSH